MLGRGVVDVGPFSTRPARIHPCRLPSEAPRTSPEHYLATRTTFLPPSPDCLMPSGSNTGFWPQHSGGGSGKMGSATFGIPFALTPSPPVARERSFLADRLSDRTRVPLPLACQPLQLLRKTSGISLRTSVRHTTGDVTDARDASGQPPTPAHRFWPCPQTPDRTSLPVTHRVNGIAVRPGDRHRRLRDTPDLLTKPSSSRFLKGVNQ